MIPTENPRTRRNTGLTRRGFLGRSAGALAATAAFGFSRPSARAATDGPRFRIGACDWSIGKMADTAAFDVAKEIGLDGVQISLGTAGNNMSLRQPEVQAKYRDAAKRTGVAIASLAIGELNNIPYKSDERTIGWVEGAVDAAQALGVKAILVAFFYKGDLKDDKAGTDEVVRRFKQVAPRAEKAGVILGIESWLSAEENMAIVDRVGSKSVQVYYDVANSEKMGYDIYKEIRWLGKKGAICEFHMKENESVLGKGRVDFAKVRDAIGEIGYSGWMQIEGGVAPGGQMLSSYVENRKFLRGLFPA